MNNFKGKGVAEPTRANNNYLGDDDDLKITNLSFSSVKSSPRNVSSKYDFVKVKVWLGDKEDHYYVLSRFLLSRMLTVTKIPNHVAIKIALELKKLLIDSSLLDVSQTDLEANLFKLMERRGYGEEYINRYKMMTSAPLGSTPVWERDFISSEELITEFCQECRIVRKGLNGDLKKAMKDGKPIIIEGMHLDPSIYLMDDEHKTTTSVTEGHQPNSQPVASDGNSAAQKETSCTSASGSYVENSQNHLVHDVFADQVNKVSKSLESIALATTSENKGETDKAAEVNGSTTRKEKPGLEQIIIPIVLKMAEFDHKGSSTSDSSSSTRDPPSANPANFDDSFDAFPLAITCHRLTGHNYLEWSQSVSIFLSGRERLGYVTGTLQQPATTAATYGKWKREDNQVMTWLLNSMTPEVNKYFLLYKTSQAIWSAVKETYSSTNNNFELFRLECQTFSLKQEDMSVTLYYHTLNSIWQQLDLYEEIAWVNPADAVLYQQVVSKRRIFQFLYGLNSALDEVRGRIIGTSPLQSLRKAFATVKQEESAECLCLMLLLHFLNLHLLHMHLLHPSKEDDLGVIIARSRGMLSTSVGRFMVSHTIGSQE